MVVVPEWVRHYALVKRFFSAEVADIDGDLPDGLSVRNAEIKPVGMSSCVAVYPHKQVKHPLASPDGQIQVSSLKISIESDWAGFTFSIERQAVPGGDMLVEISVRGVGIGV